MPHTTLRLALLLVLAVGISVGTGGFSTVGADRPVTVNVVDNDEAYVGVVACEKSNSKGTAVRLWVANRYSAPVTVESVASADSDRQDAAGTDGTVAVGDRERFEVVFEDDPETVTVAVDGDGFDVSVTREVTTKAACPYSTANQSTTSTPAE